MSSKPVYLVTLNGVLRSYGTSHSVLGVYSGKKKAEDAVFSAYQKNVKKILSFDQFRQMTRIWELPMNHTFDVGNDSDELTTHVYLGGYFE